MIELLHQDCMTYMKGCEDNAFDLAIVDPPYGIGDKMFGGGKEGDKIKMVRSLYDKMEGWDHSIPTKEYFIEMFRVSCNQIIFGGNYFDLPPTRGIICWDKQQFYPNFSQWEMAWTSFDKPAKLFKLRSSDPSRTHPTQKPVKLYEWLLTNYAEPNQKILDTHGGSMSSAVACHYFGCDLVLCEIDEDYYKSGCERFEAETSQIDLFA